MTNIKRVREITIEVERVRVVSKFKKEKINCEVCNILTDFITVSLATEVFQITEEFIAELAKNKLVHLKLNLNEEILVCLKSLLAAKEKLFQR